LPFSIACAGKDVLGEGQLLPLDPRPGLQADLFPDAAGTRQSRFEILPLHRFSRPEGVLPPFHAEFRSRLRVPEAGRFAFRVRPPGQGSVRVGGRVAFDSGAGPAAVQPWFDLTPGQGQSLAVEVAIDSRTGRLPTMILEYCGQDSSTWKVLPYGWLDLDGGH